MPRNMISGVAIMGVVLAAVVLTCLYYRPERISVKDKLGVVLTFFIGGILVGIAAEWILRMAT